MKPYRVLIVSCFVMTTLVGLLHSTVCAQQSVDSVLVKWEEASRQCKTLDAELEIIKYSPVFSSERPVCTRGHFYYVAPDFARYECGTEHGGDLSDRSITPASFVWTSEGLFINNKQDKTCLFWSSHAIQTAQQRIKQMPGTTFCERLWKGYTAMLFMWPAMMSKPDDLLPLF